jgi:hypothetical protein
MLRSYIYKTDFIFYRLRIPKEYLEILKGKAACRCNTVEQHPKIWFRGESVKWTQTMLTPLLLQLLFNEDDMLPLLLRSPGIVYRFSGGSDGGGHQRADLFPNVVS